MKRKEVCLWRLGCRTSARRRLALPGWSASLATPEEKLGISTNKPLTDALTFRKSVPRYPFQHRPKYAATKA